MKEFQIEDIMPMLNSQRTKNSDDDTDLASKQVPEPDLQLMLSVKSSIKKDLDYLKALQKNMAQLAMTKTKLKTDFDPANFF